MEVFLMMEKKDYQTFKGVKFEGNTVLMCDAKKIIYRITGLDPDLFEDNLYSAAHVGIIRAEKRGGKWYLHEEDIWGYGEGLKKEDKGNNTHQKKRPVKANRPKKKEPVKATKPQQIKINPKRVLGLYKNGEITENTALKLLGCDCDE
jgi:hypothetical protein